ncbi:putative translation elongation factor eEF-1, gamma chain [Venustampulla echinocandica]|uniref:Putative translation elongation factor eEF-1, gamma chain n=1 Tax=Venustampulla echinocandica TaxID=2656787 RepID=A0A370TID9_9HELO|nr:putative translation elongation factor eEF-1, gamma chain [Venustampulla echinocandica]RDL35123.1 putative translation elongation factor eEF-1, gamma chain [Venustampulla echinocandica]
MAPFGKLYTYPGNPRSTAILAVAKANNVELEVVETEPAKGLSPEYLKINSLAKVPTFVGADGYTLSESIAIAIYITSQNEKTTLLGKTKQDYATILKWMSFFNSEVLPPLGGWFRPLIGRSPYNRKAVEDSAAATQKAIDVLEAHLLHNTYLAGERVTLADLFAAGIISRGFQFFFDKEWRAKNPNVTRWYETVYNQPIYSNVAGELSLIETAIKNVAPKKPEQAKKEAAPKAAPKPKPAEEEEEDAPAAPKAKHPLEALPKPTLVLDEWKRQYSNHEAPEALAWFWENYKADEYSLWKIDYKYNDELTMVFMSANLVGGFFARLEGSRKYIFGAASVYGKLNDSVIQGCFVIRGQDAAAAFDVAPDFESYEFTKLDAAKPEDREFVEAQWTCEKPITVNGKEYECADSQVFK